MRRSTRWMLTLASALAISALAVPSAFAHGGNPNVIHACVRKEQRQREDRFADERLPQAAAP